MAADLGGGEIWPSGEVTGVNGGAPGGQGGGKHGSMVESNFGSK
jgi:hypothetical protein